MNKSDIVSRVAAQSSLSRAAADSVVNAVFTAICDGLAKDEAVAIAGFGTFSIKQASGALGPQSAYRGAHHNRCFGGPGVQSVERPARRGELGMSVADTCPVVRASR